MTVRAEGCLLPLAPNNLNAQTGNVSFPSTASPQNQQRRSHRISVSGCAASCKLCPGLLVTLHEQSRRGQTVSERSGVVSVIFKLDMLMTPKT